MAKFVPSIEVSTPEGQLSGGNNPDDENFNWAVMSLIDVSPKKTQGQKRKSMLNLESPGKCQTMEKGTGYGYETHHTDSEASSSSQDEEPCEDKNIPQSAFETLRAARTPLKAKKLHHDFGLSPNRLQVQTQTHGNLETGLSPSKRKLENRDETPFVLSPAKFVIGNDMRKIVPEQEPESVTLEIPQFPTRTDSFRTPIKAVRRLSGAFEKSD